MNADEHDARIRVNIALFNMPYGGSVSAVRPVIDPEQDIVDFLNEVGSWLEALRVTLESVTDTTTDMAQELTELRSQRKAARDFLGIRPDQ
jgi:hypothetical protein